MVERREGTELVARARAGDGGALWFVGEPGVGKSALLDAVCDDRPGDVRLVRVSGRESEQDLAWAGLADLLEPLLADGLDASVPVPQRTALRSALALDVADGPVEPYAVLVAALGVLRAAAGAGALLAVVDDAHWLDGPSRLAVEFVARRAAGSRLAIVVATRPEVDVRPGLPVVTLEPLADDECRLVLADLGVTSPSVRQRLVDELGGIPLLLEAAATALTAAQRDGTAALPSALPVPSTAVALAERRVAELTPEVRLALLAVASAPSTDLATVAAVLDAVGSGPTMLEALEAQGMVVLDEGRVAFTHPTVRTAAFQGAGSATRRAVHAAVAAVVAEPSTAAWHRAQSAAGPDEEVASALEGQAALLGRRGAPIGAARFLEVAARLSPSTGDAARRLRLAAEAASEAGEDAVASALVDRAEHLAEPSGSQEERWRRRRLRLLLRQRAGGVEDVIVGLQELADEVGDELPGLAAQLLLDALPPLVYLLRPAEVLDVATRARDHARRAGDEALVRRAEVAQGVGRLGSGDGAGQDQLIRYAEVLEAEGAVAAGPFLAEVVGPCLAVFQRTPEVAALFTRLESDCRAASAAPALVSVLASRAIVTQRVDLAGAVALAEEAVDLAEQIGRPAMSPVAAVSLAYAAAGVGDERACRRGADLLVGTGEPSLLAPALTGVGLLELAYGRLAEALTVYERLVDEAGIGTGLVRWEADWCEVLVRLGRVDQARVAVDRVAAAEAAWLASGGLARVRGLLAEDLGEAESAFALSVDFLGMVGNTFGAARSELCWAERLRRGRRRAAARRHAAEAARRFEEIGARRWCELATRELAALEGTPGAGVTGIQALSSRELAVARLAAAGATNREIGDELYLSARTVEAHLSAVFRKLGIRNRRELAARATEEPALRR